MRSAILLLLFIAAPLYSAEQTYLFIPREDHPFFLNSAAGEFSIEKSDDRWPDTLALRTGGDGRTVQLVAHDLPVFSLENRKIVIWVKADNLSEISELWLYAADSNDFENRVVFRISDDKASLRGDIWTRISLPLSAGSIWGSPDLTGLKAFQIWLKDSGKSAVTINIGPVYLLDADEQPAAVFTYSDGTEPQDPAAAQDIPADWNQPTVFQPAAAANRTVIGDGASMKSADRQSPLSVRAAGNPPLEMKTQLDYSLDWRMIWGPGTAGAEYYTQIDDLMLYLQSELGEGTVLHASAGIGDVNFTDFSTRAIDGSLFYLNSLYMDQHLPEGFTVSAGYYSPDPFHKWLQVTRSAGIEPAFGQDITPSSLWIGLSWDGLKPFGIQAALMPDIFGITDSVSSLTVAKYQQSLGIPNLFASAWVDTENIDAEAAAALNGDALKIAAAGAYYHDFEPGRLAASIGIKYTAGTDFSTYPLWDHIDGAWRLSSGVSAVLPLNEITVTPGLAYQAVIYGGGSLRHLAGVDLGLSYRLFELYSVLSFLDLAAVDWGETAGIEAGLKIDYNGIDYIIGYAMSGFSAVSGLYNNNPANDGGIDGLFIRIKATYW